MAKFERPRVVVLGSVHMDLIAAAKSMPKPGLSVRATNFTMGPGGKAANQACQLSRDGCDVAIVSALGCDAFGDTLLTALSTSGIDAAAIRRDERNPTGASTIMAVKGEYASIIAPGAAAHMTPNQIDECFSIIAGAKALVLQFELPLELSLRAAEIAAGAGVMVIVNASPPLTGSGLSSKVLRLANVLVVNRAEANALLASDNFSAEKASKQLAEKFPSATVLVTDGKAGSFGCQGGRLHHQKAFPIKPSDSIGAGDAYLGSLVASLLRGAELSQAMHRATAAATLVVSRQGAFDAMPSGDEIDEYLGRH